MKEAELIEAARSGDQDAFQELRRTHVRHVRIACWAILRTDDLDDLLQDVFVHAWKGLKAFRGQSTFRTWVTSIARRCAFKVLEQRKGKGAFLAELPDEDHSSLGEERSAAHMESCVELAQLMSGLPARNRQLLEMNLEGLSDREIANALALSLSAVRGRLQRTRDSMREKIRTAPEQIRMPRSLISNKGIAKRGMQGEGVPKMSTASRKKTRPLKTGVADVALLSVGSPEGAEFDRSSQETASNPDLFSFEDLVAEVAQLEYLAVIEARRQFEAELVREAENRLRASIRNLLSGSDFDSRHEEAAFLHAARAMGAKPNVPDNFARLQLLPMGVYSREVRLWYSEEVAQDLLPEAVSYALREVETIKHESAT